MEPSHYLINSLTVISPYISLQDHEKLKLLNKLIYQCAKNNFQYYLNNMVKDFAELTDFRDIQNDIIEAKKSPEKALSLYSGRYKEIVSLKQFLKLQVDINKIDSINFRHAIIENAPNIYEWFKTNDDEIVEWFKNNDQKILNLLRIQFKLLEQISESSQTELTRLFFVKKVPYKEEIEFMSPKKAVWDRLIDILFVKNLPPIGEKELEAVEKAKLYRMPPALLLSNLKLDFNFDLGKKPKGFICS